MKLKVVAVVAVASVFSSAVALAGEPIDLGKILRINCVAEITRGISLNWSGSGGKFSFAIQRSSSDKWEFFAGEAKNTSKDPNKLKLNTLSPWWDPIATEEDGGKMELDLTTGRGTFTGVDYARARHGYDIVPYSFSGTLSCEGESQPADTITKLTRRVISIAALVLSGGSALAADPSIRTVTAQDVANELAHHVNEFALVEPTFTRGIRIIGVGVQGTSVVFTVQKLQRQGNCFDIALSGDTEGPFQDMVNGRLINPIQYAVAGPFTASQIGQLLHISSPNKVGFQSYLDFDVELSTKQMASFHASGPFLGNSILPIRNINCQFAR
jgi:hypothetical protein